MTLSLYDAAVPPVLKILAAQRRILDKAATHCAQRRITPTVILKFRLAPDMHPFSRHLHSMTDHALALASRLAELDSPSLPDTEISFDALKTRIARSEQFIGDLAAERFDGAESRSVTVRIGGADVTSSGLDYLFHFALPSFYYHSTIAYSILRHCGVDITRRDYLGLRR
jgi:hypothetical protein